MTQVIITLAISVYAFIAGMIWLAIALIQILLKPSLPDHHQEIVTWWQALQIALCWPWWVCATAFDKIGKSRLKKFAIAVIIAAIAAIAAVFLGFHLTIGQLH